MNTENNVNNEVNLEAPVKKSRFPHIYVLLVSLIAVCVILTWILPAGSFDRVENESGRMVVVPGTYHSIDATPVGPFQGVQAIYRGMIDAAPIIFFVFISYAAISLVISSGSFDGLISLMLRKLRGKAKLAMIPIFLVVIGIGSSTIGIAEEMYPFIPLFVSVAIAMGYDAIVGVTMVVVATGIGYSAAAMNPFNVGLAQAIAELQPLSGAWFRIMSHAIFIVVVSIYTIRYALKIQADPTKSVVYGDDFGELERDTEAMKSQPFGVRQKLVIAILGIGIGVIVWGCKTYGWYLNELSAVFLIMAICTAIVMNWGPNTIAEKMAAGITEIAIAGVMIGIARGVLIVMQDGQIIDTIVNGLALPLMELPRWLAMEAMLIVQTFLSFIIPSGSGQAVTSMPIMAPLADVLHINRQIAVLAFQFSDGISNCMWPTAMVPILCGISKIKIDKWIKWFLPLFCILLVTQGALLGVALLINYQ